MSKKEDLPYFSHDNDASEHPKFKALRARYGAVEGWAAVGRFWALNEAVARSKGARLDLSKKVNRATMAVDLGLSLSDFDGFLSFLIP